jgi:DUF971 family protein
MHATDDAGEPPPTAIHLEKSRGLTVTWRDGSRGFVELATLRRMSQSAEARQERDAMASNPLHVLKRVSNEPLTALGAELVGNYALRIRFSDGHDTGLYAWNLLRTLATPIEP